MHVDRDQEHSLEQVQTYGGVKLGYVCLTHRLTKFNALIFFSFFGTLPIKQWFLTNFLFIAIALDGSYLKILTIPKGSSKDVNQNRTDNKLTKWKGHTMIDKALHRKLKFE
jgi:hypothetical protein